MGTLYFEGNKPEVGDQVMIVVDSVNSPTGIWNGELVEVGDNEHSPDRYRAEYRWVSCRAKITDTILGTSGIAHYTGREPTVNYNVFVRSSGTDFLNKQLDEAKAEIKGLSKRLKIEREVLYGALRAMTNDDAVSHLEKLLKELLSKK